MTMEKKLIKEYINDGLSVISKMRICVNSPAGPNTRKMKEIVKKLFPLIANDYPLLSEVLSKAETRLIENGIINPFCFGDIRTSLKILKGIYCRPPKIFISHKSEDVGFVNALVNLLRLYIGSDGDKIFCSSVPNYKIGLGKDIYPEIKAQFEKNDVFMIIIHSPRYYQSPICLNEMGAAWIQSTECCSFLTSDCEYDNLQGVIDKNYISIKVNALDAKDRMNEFIGNVLDFFQLPKPDFSSFSRWEKDRDAFLNEVCK